MEKINNVLIKILEKACWILLMVITALTFSEVVGRYVFGSSISWSHETILLLTIWMVWLGIPIGFDRWEHMKMTFFVDENTRVGKFRFLWFHVFLSFIYFAIIFIFAIPMMDGFVGMEFTTIALPVNAKYMASAVGGFLTMFVLLAKIVRLFREN